ncbi:MAG: hypothetical protein HYS13_23435 [Planctomycetia bacterium]|nr:hypothetical protein [Planctomycetia bacterium]
MQRGDLATRDTAIPKRTAVAAIAALLVGHVAAACVVAGWGWLIDAPDVSLEGLTILALAQASALAVWVAFGPGPAFLRAPALPFGVGASCGLTAVFQDVRPDEVKGTFGIILSLAVVQLVPLLVLRYFGLRIAACETIEASRSQRLAPVQFSIRHLLALTLAVAVLLALWRWNPFAPGWGERSPFDSDTFQFAGLFMLVLVAAWAGCGRGAIVARLLVLGAATLTAAILPLAINGRIYFYDIREQEATTLLTALVVAGTFLVVRGLRCRLTWRQPTVPAADDDAGAETTSVTANSAHDGPSIVTTSPSVPKQPAEHPTLLAHPDARDAAIGLMVLAHAVVQLLLVSLAFGGWWRGGGSLSLYRDALLSLSIAQAAMLGAWLALWPRRWFVRLPTSALLVLGMIAVAGASSGASRWPRGAPSLADWEEPAAVLSGWFAWAVLVCLLVRAAGGRIELVASDRDCSRSPLGAALRHLAAGAAAVAAILLAWPALLAAFPLAADDLVRPLAMTAAVGVSLWTGLSAAPFLARLVTLLSALSALAYPPPFLFPELADAFLAHTASVFLPGIAVALTFFTLSACGYRLVWGDRAAKDTMAPPDENREAAP